MGGAARILKNNPRSSETLSLDKCQMCGVIGNNRLLFTRMAPRSASIAWQSPASLPQIKCGKTRTIPGFPQ